MRKITQLASALALTVYGAGTMGQNLALAEVIVTAQKRVEFLKGPQGILFGKNTVVGALSIITAKPAE